MTKELPKKNIETRLIRDTAEHIQAQPAKNQVKDALHFIGLYQTRGRLDMVDALLVQLDDINLQHVSDAIRAASNGTKKNSGAA